MFSTWAAIICSSCQFLINVKSQSRFVFTFLFFKFLLLDSSDRAPLYTGGNDSKDQKKSIRDKSPIRGKSPIRDKSPSNKNRMYHSTKQSWLSFTQLNITTLTYPFVFYIIIIIISKKTAITIATLINHIALGRVHQKTKKAIGIYFT